MSPGDSEETRPGFTKSWVNDKMSCVGGGKKRSLSKMHFPSRTKRKQVQLCNATTAQTKRLPNGTQRERFWNTRSVSRQLINQRKRSASNSSCRNTGQETEAEDKNRTPFTADDNPGRGGEGEEEEGRRVRKLTRPLTI